MRAIIIIIINLASTCLAAPLLVIRNDSAAPENELLPNREQDTLQDQDGEDNINNLFEEVEFPQRLQNAEKQQANSRPDPFGWLERAIPANENPDIGVFDGLRFGAMPFGANPVINNMLNNGLDRQPATLQNWAQDRRNMNFPPAFRQISVLQEDPRRSLELDSLLDQILAAPYTKDGSQDDGNIKENEVDADEDRPNQDHLARRDLPATYIDVMTKRHTGLVKRSIDPQVTAQIPRDEWKDWINSFDKSILEGFYGAILTLGTTTAELSWDIDTDARREVKGASAVAAFLMETLLPITDELEFLIVISPDGRNNQRVRREMAKELFRYEELDPTDASTYDDGEGELVEVKVSSKGIIEFLDRYSPLWSRFDAVAKSLSVGTYPKSDGGVYRWLSLDRNTDVRSTFFQIARNLGKLFYGYSALRDAFDNAYWQEATVSNESVGGGKVGTMEAFSTGQAPIQNGFSDDNEMFRSRSVPQTKPSNPSAMKSPVIVNGIGAQNWRDINGLSAISGDVDWTSKSTRNLEGSNVLNWVQEQS